MMSKWSLWLKQKTATEISEKQRHSRYYEHDGALRAYANRAMVLAFLSAGVALIAVGLAAYVRLQPPTVIRVDGNGNAANFGKAPSTVSVSQTAAEAEPSDLEKYAFVKSFLDHYETFAPSTINRNWADALNMMTSNLRHQAVVNLRKENRVGNVEDGRMRCEFSLRRLEPSQQDPLTYEAFGVKEVHKVGDDHSETSQKIVSEFHIRLVADRRSRDNPSGLLIGEFWEQPIEGERRDLILQEAPLEGQNLHGGASR